MPLYFVIGAVAIVVGGIALHFKAAKTRVPLGTLNVGDKIIVDSKLGGFDHGGHGEFVFQLTSVTAPPSTQSLIPQAFGSTLRGISIDPRLPMSPLGIGPNPIPIALKAIVSRAK